MYDILIKNGIVIDGTGKKRFNSDVAIKEGKIVRIGNMSFDVARQTVDARGKFVTPGFIDVNNHSDTYWQIFKNPNLESLLYQGITTIIGGNSGSSLAPLVSVDALNTIRKWTDMQQVNFDWSTADDLFLRLDAHKLSVNFASLVGHATMRRGFLGDENRHLTDEELLQLQGVFRRALSSGMVGLSTALGFTHARLTSGAEISTLLSDLKSTRKLYVAHLYNESSGVLSALDQALGHARISGVSVHISHLKVAGRSQWHKLEDIFAFLQQASTDGVSCTFDVYPYTSTASVLYQFLPNWITEGGREMMLIRLKDRNLRKKAISDMHNQDFDYSRVIVSMSPLSKILTNIDVASLSRLQNKLAEEVVVDLLLACEGRIIALLEVLSEDNVRAELKHPASIISTNGSGYSIDHKKTRERVHQRNFGAMSRFLGKYVRDEQLLPFEEAIFKITGKPASVFGLHDRGIIKSGAIADVVVFDPKTINDLSTFENPYVYASGVEWLFINGHVTIANSQYKNERHGKVIRV